MEKQTAFQVSARDNVATALGDITPGTLTLRGDAAEPFLAAEEAIAKGHKIALADIPKGEAIRKYGVAIGRATCDIQKGRWVHLHCMESCYDERSGHLDPVTGAPTDTQYE